MSDRTPHNVLSDSDLRILCCPLTRSPLRRDGEFLTSDVSGLRYPVRDGIPVLLIEEAQLPSGVASLEELRTRLRL